jgi:hypothetical protein
MSYQVKFHKDTSSELASIMVHKPLLFSFLVENIFKCFESCENEDAVASVIKRHTKKCVITENRQIYFVVKRVYIHLEIREHTIHIGSVKELPENWNER